MNIILKGFLGAALVVGIFVYAAPPAEAGKVCNSTTICGKVTNAKTSNRSVYIARDWGKDAPTPPTAYNRAFVAAGRSSASFFTDTDGFRTHSTCKTYRWNDRLNTYIGQTKGKWYKILDSDQILVKIAC